MSSRVRDWSKGIVTVQFSHSVGVTATQSRTKVIPNYIMTKIVSFGRDINEFASNCQGYLAPYQPWGSTPS
eukprot:11180886-Lingulodinium_polyedra.AAC.1